MLQLEAVNEVLKPTVKLDQHDACLKYTDSMLSREAESSHLESCVLAYVGKYRRDDGLVSRIDGLEPIFLDGWENLAEMVKPVQVSNQYTITLGIFLRNAHRGLQKALEYLDTIFVVLSIACRVVHDGLLLGGGLLPLQVCGYRKDLCRLLVSAKNPTYRTV
jgi:hypothetical protein